MATNEQVISDFVSGKENRTENIFSEGLAAKDIIVLYSYGRHFPLAIRLSDGHMIMNIDKYSVTTSKHQSKLRSFLSNSATGTTKSIKELISHIQYKCSDKRFDVEDLKLYQF
jgi:hypothetical protein